MKKSWNANNTIYIMAPKGYARESVQKQGVCAVSPFYCDNMPFRPLRELCFRLPFLPKKIWYNKEVIQKQWKYIIIIDVNITKDYLNWVKRIFPEAQINFLYDNMIGKARNIIPRSIPQGIRVWTYDDYDSRKYNIMLYNNYWIKEIIMNYKKTKEIFDVFFVGKDKGRGEKLLKLEHKLNNMGLKTKMIITKDGKTSRKKWYHQDPIPYEKVLNYDTKSRAILNITMENQEGITMRDMEALTIGVKLVTTNKNIINKDLYHPNNVFVIGIDKFKDFKEFLSKEYVNMLDQIKEKHTFKAMMDEITS